MCLLFYLFFKFGYKIHSKIISSWNFVYLSHEQLSINIPIVLLRFRKRARGNDQLDKLFKVTKKKLLLSAEFS